MVDTSDSSTAYFSRSALASKLDVSLKELTQVMLDAGWLLHNEEAGAEKQWSLTSKGEFEGGIYRESKKFGHYIVWPESILSHQVIKDLQSSYVSATTIAQIVNLPVKTMNKLFADLGWITHFGKGWNTTERGRNNGAVQQENSETGIAYVCWRRSILESNTLLTHIKQYQGEVPATRTEKIAGKLHYRLLNGVWVESLNELHLGNYLYIYGLTYAYQRNIDLGGKQSIIADFYLPIEGIAILINQAHINPSALAIQVERQALIEKSSLQYIVVNSLEMASIDKVLPKALIACGVSIY